ncbi:hypothetical protein GobsT_53230 [Gemmata obscuriglobus]|uniref:Uncharacterized protein n=1 Tax=Gemmata obscuriglobus TaxID=114 RepID=A0A2Z3GSR8_9BACT|nr:hypothetical protein C1280_07150 [Gemmata obscuriglobus]QEG30518.1 hypothetical protein GobsT_53230 [Gemmata obscuriglobus]VTS09842.1 unnamed protein product [Gemmata obscuriglobus UQM 2246]
MPGWQPFYPFDFLPLSDLVIEAYVLFPGGWLRPYTWEKASDHHGAVATLHPALRVDWSEPFHVVADGQRRFVITESGRMFSIPVGAKEGSPLERVRTDEPVRALISDPATGRSFAFTANTVFEVGETIAPRPHKLGSLDARTGDDVIATAARCARVIRAFPLPTVPPPRERTSY